MAESRKLRVFLCHASQDKSIVHELYQRLLDERWIDPWLDVMDLLPGQDWRTAIQEAVEKADNVIICLSNNSVSKEGYVQKEMRYAQEISLEKPEGTIFLIPLRLEDCDVPRGLRFFQWTNYFGEQKEQSYEDLIKSLQTRLEEKIRKEEEERERLEALERARLAEEKARQKAEARALEQKERRKAESLRRKQEQEKEKAKEKELQEEKARKEAEEQARKEAEDRIRRQAERKAYQKERRLTRAKIALDIEKKFGFKLAPPVIESFPKEAFNKRKRRSNDVLWWSIIILIIVIILWSDLKGYLVSVQINQLWAGILLTLWVMISSIIGVITAIVIYALNILKSDSHDVTVKYGDVIDDNLVLLFQNGILGTINLNTMSATILDSGHNGSNKFFVFSNDNKILLEEGFIVDTKKEKRVRRLRKMHSYDNILSTNQNKNIWAVNKIGDIEIRNFSTEKEVCSFRSFFIHMALFTNKGDDIVLGYQEKNKEKKEYVSRFEILNLVTKNKMSSVIHQFHAEGLYFAMSADDGLLVFANGNSILVYSILENREICFLDLGQQIHSVAFLHNNNFLVVSLQQELLILNINNHDQFSVSYKPKAITNLLYLSERKEILGIDKPRAAIYRWKIEDVSDNKN